MAAENIYIEQTDSAPYYLSGRIGNSHAALVEALRVAATTSCEVTALNLVQIAEFLAKDMSEFEVTLAKKEAESLIKFPPVAGVD